MGNVPPITLAQLSEYLTVGPGRRRSIVDDILDPKPFMVAVYNDASALMTRLCYGAGDAAALAAQGLEDLARKTQAKGATDQRRQNARLSKEAAEGAMLLLEQLRRPGRETVPIAQRVPPFIIEGMQVNVRPEAFVRDSDGRNRPSIGAVKFHFPKTRKLNVDRASYMGAILHWYCEHVFGEDECDCRSSYVVDVLAGRLHQAPKATKRRRDDIRAACEELRGRLSR